MTTCRELYHTLVQSFPGALAVKTQDPPSSSTFTNLNSTANAHLLQPLSRSDYPKVRFWFRRDWFDRKKERSGITKFNQTSRTVHDKGRGPPEKNVSLRYIEDDQGVVIDGFRASEMRKFARSIWNQLAIAGKAPKSWGKSDLEVATHYRHEMRHRFPELGLCEFDWKAEQLATDNYPNWASHNLQGVSVKMESSTGASASASTSKRRSDSADHISKKAKIESSTPVAVNATPSGPPPIDSSKITTSANIPSVPVLTVIPTAIPTITSVAVNATPSGPLPIDSSRITTSANLPSSSDASAPATTIPIAIPTTNVHATISTTIASTPTGPFNMEDLVDVDSVPTDGMDSFVGELDSVNPTSLAVCSTSIAMYMKTREAPALGTTVTPPAIVDVEDGDRPAAEAVDRFHASSPWGDAPKVMPRVCVSLKYIVRALKVIL